MAPRPRKPPVDPATFHALDIRAGVALAARPLPLEGTRKPFMAPGDPHTVGWPLA